MILQRLAQLRLQARQVNEEIGFIMPDAISEALSIFQSQGNSRIIYKDQSAKIVLSFRQCFATEENQTLARLDADIKAATIQLARKHAIELEQIDSQIKQLELAIAQLEAKRDKLLGSRYVLRLKKEYKIQKKQSAYLQPNLSVFLK